MELEIKDVIHTYPNKKTALNRISLTLTPGIYGLLGPNGAGKSTLMKIITGNMQPSGGKVLFNGSDIKELGRAYRDRLGYMPQQQGLYNQFTGRRFLWYMATLKGLSHREAKYKINNLLEQMNLTEVADRKIGGYSGGMKQRLLIAQAVMNSPDILVLDEPTAGLDPQAHREILEMIQKIRLERGCSVVLVSHNMDDVARLCDNVLVMHGGRLALRGTPEEVFSRDRMLKDIGLGLPAGGELMWELKKHSVSLINDTEPDADKPKTSIITEEAAVNAVIKYINGKQK